MRWAFLLVVMAACSSSNASDQCKQVCKRDAECVAPEREGEPSFDRAECEETCEKLERDPKGREIVETHSKCVATAGDDCAAVRACL